MRHFIKDMKILEKIQIQAQYNFDNGFRNARECIRFEVADGVGAIMMKEDVEFDEKRGQEAKPVVEIVWFEEIEIDED
jgi:hypothetical protein